MLKNEQKISDPPYECRFFRLDPSRKLSICQDSRSLLQIHHWKFWFGKRKFFLHKPEEKLESWSLRIPDVRHYFFLRGIFVNQCHVTSFWIRICHMIFKVIFYSFTKIRILHS